MEPSLEGAFAGQGLDPLLREVDPDQTRPPGGVVSPELNGRSEGGRAGERGRIGRADVIGCQAPRAALAPPSEQGPYGARGDVEGAAQLGGRCSLLPTTPHGLPDWLGHGGWHG